MSLLFLKIKSSTSIHSQVRATTNVNIKIFHWSPIFVFTILYAWKIVAKNVSTPLWDISQKVTCVKTKYSSVFSFRKWTFGFSGYKEKNREKKHNRMLTKYNLTRWLKQELFLYFYKQHFTLTTMASEEN